MDDWRTIKEYPNYTINSKGAVMNCKTKRLLSLKTDKRGAKYACLCKNNTKKYLLVHRLVLKMFLGEPSKKAYSTNHINGNPSDNRLCNLEWCTPKQNTQHALRTGLRKNVGENNWKAKLTKKDVLVIRKSNKTQKELSVIYKVGQPHISSIKKNKVWKNI